MRRTGSDPQVPEIEPEVFDRAAASVVLTLGPDHRMVYSNAAFRRLFGPRRLGVPAAEAFDEPQAAGFVHMLDEVYRTHRAGEFTFPGETEDAGDQAPDRRHFVYSALPVVSRYGPGVLGIAVETTAQVEAARRTEARSEERRRTVQRYEALMSAVPQIIWVLKPDWSIEELVGGFEEFTGMPWRSRVDAEWLAAVHPHDRDHLLRTWENAAAGTRRSSSAPSG